MLFSVYSVADDTAPTPLLNQTSGLNNLLIQVQLQANDYALKKDKEIALWQDLHRKSVVFQQQKPNIRLFILSQILTFYAQEQNAKQFEYWYEQLEQFKSQIVNASAEVFDFYADKAQFERVYYSHADLKAIELGEKLIKRYFSSVIAQNSNENYLNTLLIQDNVQINLDDYATTLNSLGYSLFVTDHYSLAQPLFMQAQSLFNKSHNLKGQARSFNNLSLIAWAQQDYDLAIKSLTKATQLSKQINDVASIIRGYNNLGVYLKAQEKYEQALIAFHNTLDQPEINQYLRIKSNTLVGIADTHIELKQLAKAEAYIQLGLLTAKETKDESLVMSAKMTQSHLYHLKNDFQQSIEVQLQTLIYYKNKGMKHQTMMNLLGLSENYQALKDLDSALLYYQQYHQHKIELMQEAQNNSVNQLQATYESNNKLKKIELLEKENQLNQIAIKSADTEHYFIVFAAGALVIILLLLFSRYYARKEQRRLLKHNEEIAKREKQLDLLSIAFKNTADAVWITNEHFEIEVVNQAYIDQTQRTLACVAFKPLQLAQVKEQDNLLACIKQELQHESHWQGEIFEQNEDGDVFPVELEIDVIFNEQQQISHYLGIFRNISEKLKVQEALRKLATHDDLTGLPNRQLFAEITQRACVNYLEGKPAPVILTIDIDNFKKINESFGHDMGDKVIQFVANELATKLKTKDVIAHIAGSKFTVLLELKEPKLGAAIVAQKLQSLFHQQTVIDETAFNLSISIGIAVYPDDSKDPQALIQKAAIALLNVKSTDNTSVSFYEQRMNDEVEAPLEKEQALLSAVMNNEFEFHYQPIVGVQSNSIQGAEALIRWRQADDSLIYPDQFIPFAEKTGLIEQIDLVVIDQVFAQVAKWQKQKNDVGAVSINLSARLFSQPDKLISLLSEKLLTYLIPPHLIKLEITEGMLLTNISLAIETMEQIKALGFKLVLDDFGTGFSSLNYLKQFPIDILKIDRSFIMDMHHSTTDQSIVKTIIELAHILDINVVAEGVEMAVHLDSLKQMHCEEYQGYYFSKPLCLAAFQQLINS